MTVLHIQKHIGHKHEGDYAVVVEEDVDLAHTLFREAQTNGMLIYGKNVGEVEKIVYKWDDIEQYEHVTAIPRYVGG